MPDTATIARLADTPRWQALLHYNPGATLRGVGESYVDDPNFFLASDGATNAADELAATIQALAKPDSPARCRYPARYKFVATQLGWDTTDALAHCTDYQDWRDRMPIGRLVMVFPAAYLNSPSSMFGHTLLRLDASAKPESAYLSRAINFSAQSTGADGSALYVWRGLVGGYPGRFSVNSYVETIHRYGFIENRDIWEYPLNLDHDALDWLVRHLWELRGVNFDYFFFDENCSFRLLELIHVARPDLPLLAGQRFAELPVHTIRTLVDAGLVSDNHYRPSKIHTLQRYADPLSSSERALTKRLTRNTGLLETPAFQDLRPAARHRVAQVAYQALRVDGRTRQRDKSTAHDSLALLRAIQRNPAPAAAPATPPAPPEKGHATHLISLAGGRIDGASYGEFGFRMTYHDVLDRPQGFPTGAGIQGLDLKLRAYDNGDIELERLGLVNIRSIAPRGTFFKPISWFVDSGLEQTPAGSTRQLGLYLDGGPGLSWRVGDVVPYVFAAARLETVATQEPTFGTGLGANAGALWITPTVQWGLELSQRYFAQGFHRTRAGLSANLPVSRNNALRARCEYESWNAQGQADCQLSFRHFF
ncbi:DUF4105 domain-containing protein [Salinisphaera sp. Q1T1-3]|uniref:Lnb N-terminal periplasmic domain-containing protein n=1 Tax=Salinisphaera sp. Q1T1-3 TaxID=2321229 RepID=UPI001314ACAF|nr:DUF4105 domain-containing protein [Salinisphaera sp. Q1T1-3]